MNNDISYLDEKHDSLYNNNGVIDVDMSNVFEMNPYKLFYMTV